MLAGNILRFTALRVPDKTAVVCGDASVTFRELDRTANRFAHALIDRQLGADGTVAVMSRNSIDYVAMHYGGARSGKIVGHLWVSFAANEIVHILSRAHTELVVVEEALQDRIAAVRDRLPGLKQIVVVGTPAIPGAVSYAEFIAGKPETEPAVALDADDPFCLSFTGGTTGFPKGILASHRARYISLVTAVIEQDVKENDVVCAATPLFHAIGLLIWMPGAIMVGATCVLMPKWDAGQFVALAARHGITNSLFVPTQLREVLSEAHFNGPKLATLRKVICGGAPTTPELYDRLMGRLPGADFTDNYGCTEAGPLCFLKPWHPRDKIGSVGRPAINIELRIADANGDPVAPGEVGEIITRGAHLVAGYFGDPEETARLFRRGDEWGWTGDLASADADGFITLVGRSKDMIVSGGVNVYPREVELVIERHPAVHEVAAFGIPDEKWGEAMAAYVVVKPGARVGAEELSEYCGQHIARLKRPRVIVFVDAIPRTPTNKISKVLLRSHYLAQHGDGTATA